ncbi:TPA: hypothetical protein KOR75_001086 [Clostridioides difficile]|nr:hypothetical protein [Clostridioides difficile]
MISREKMFVVSEILDESIKSQTAVFDVRLFKTFVEFESYIEGTPIIINTLVVTSRELPFNNSNMTRLSNVVGSPFLRIDGQVIYVIDKSFDKKVVNKFFDSNNLGVEVVVYQNDLSLRYVTDIVTGEARDVQENKTYDVVYRVRASEYMKQQSTLSYDTLDKDYITDEDDMAGIPEEEIPEDVIPEATKDLEIKYVCGEDREERTAMVFLLSQYLSLSSKTIIIEHDRKYHRLTEFYTKSQLDGLFITVMEIYQNVEEVINRIKNTNKRLIVIGTIERVKYDYNFLFTLLYNNLRGYVDYMIMECDYHELPYNVNVVYVTSNIVPEIIKMATSIKQVVIPEKTKFIGMQMNTLNPCYVNTLEMLSIISAILQKNGLDGQVLYSGGIKLKEDTVIYDIFSIIS